MELAEFLRQLDPVIKDLEAKVKTDQWYHHGKRFRKVEIIWISQPNETATTVGLSVVNEVVS